MRLTKSFMLMLFLLLLTSISTVRAEDNPLAQLNWQMGPTSGTLGDEATITVPDGYVFLGQDDTKKFLELSQNIASGDEFLLAPKDLSWFSIFEFNPVGYVKDDETLDADSVLDSVKEGTQAGNAERQKRGWGTLTVLGWRFEPRYDNATHRLEWALLARDDATQTQIINYKTRLLGRSGVMKVVLVADPATLDTSVSDLNQLLNGFDYVQGERYADYRKGDHLAEFGLAALIAGGAAAIATKKGFWAVLGGFIAAGWKFVAAGVAGLFAWLRGSKKNL